MDETGYSIIAQVAAKAATEIMCSMSPPMEQFVPEDWDAIYRHIGKSIIGSAKAAYKAEHSGAPFAPAPQQHAPPQQVPQAESAPAPQPVPQSQPVAQPSPPQAVMSGPPCPQCQTPMAMTKDYAAKKARNLSEGKKPPPMWKCPMGSWSRQTGAQGCQGCQFEDAA